MLCVRQIEDSAAHEGGEPYIKRSFVSSARFFFRLNHRVCAHRWNPVRAEGGSNVLL